MKTYTTLPAQERTVGIACNLCHQELATTFLEDETYTFVRCPDCGLVYQNPQPVFDDLRKRYSHGYFEYEIDNEANFFHLMKLGMHDIGFDQLVAKMDQVPGSERLGEHRTFLDIGCATGMLLEHMRASGWSVRGVDLTPESAAYGRENRGLEIYAGTLEEAALPSDSQSVVHFSHVIEHVPDPRAFLSEVVRVVEPGGLVLITTPNVRGLQARLFGERWRSAIADHVYLFTKTTLRRYLNEVGLVPARLVTWGGLAVGSAPTWIKRPLDRMAKRLGFGDVMMVAATLPPATEGKRRRLIQRSIGTNLSNLIS